MFEDLISFALNDSTAITVGVILAILTAFALLKKLIKLAFLSVILVVLYFGSFNYFGVDPDDAIEKTKELIKDIDTEELEKAAKEAGEKIEEAIEKVLD